jgi:hypothetical protein
VVWQRCSCWSACARCVMPIRCEGVAAAGVESPKEQLTGP